MNYFITGTDTGVGKTFVVSLMLRALRQSGRDAVGMKPICCGARDDALALFEASGKAAPVDEINPIWLPAPAAPYVAAATENRTIDLDRIRQSFARLHASHRSLLVEGVGGWLVPIKKGYWVSDLAAEVGFPVVVVTPNRLGAINHAVLTVRSIKSMGLHCAGIIFNHVDSNPGAAASTNGSIIEEFTEVPLLFTVGAYQKDLAMDVVL